MSKKILSVLLALVMVLAMSTVALVSVSADLADLPEVPAGYYRYYFYMPEQWINDYTNVAGIYWWEGTDACTSWPGYEAYPADYENVYYYDVPQDVTTIIWSNFLDGGQDPTLDIYTAAVQTVNIPCEYYDAGESENYPEGTENFNGMIYVTDTKKIDTNPFSGKQTFGGEWAYYYGNGEYGFTPEKGAEVMTDPAFNWDPDFTVPIDTGVGTTAATETTVEATTTEAPATTTEAPATTTEAPATTTEAPVTTTEAAKADVATIIVDGKAFEVEVGATFTYEFTLTTPTNVENAQATSYFDESVVELIPGKAKEMFPVLRDVTSVVYNTDIPGEVKFNATEGVEEGFDFTEGGVLVSLQFKALTAGTTEISTTIEEMVKFGEAVDYATGGVIVNDEVKTAETVIGGKDVEIPTTTETAPIETSTATEPVETSTATDPVETSTATEPVETKPVETKPVETKPADKTEPVETTAAPEAPVETTAAPATGLTSATEAGTTAAATDAPNTGAAAYIYVVMAVLAMAACAVVVLRKRVNG